MLQGLHPTHLALGDPGHVLEGQVGHESKHQDLALVGRQRRERGFEFGIDARRRRLVGGHHLGNIGRRRRAVAPEATVRVDGSVVGDGEDPPSGSGVVAREPLDVACHVEEDLTEDIIGIGDALGPEVAEHGRGQRAIQGCGLGAVGQGADRTRR